MAIRVRQPGLLTTTVQDTGRFGEYALGMRPQGYGRLLLPELAATW